MIIDLLYDRLAPTPCFGSTEMGATHQAIFPGRDYLNQLRLIIDILGTPSEQDLACITNQQAVHFLRSLPPKPRKPWSEIFPKASPQVKRGSATFPAIVT